MLSAILFISFFAMLLIGMPIAICLGLSSVFTVLYAANFVPKYSMLTLSIVATNTYTGISKFLLLAIPFFVLSGNIMAKAGILMTRYGMKFEDAYALYGKYIGDWGARATEFRFDAVKNGAVVKSVRRSAVTALRLSVTPSHTVLRHGATYDVAALRLAVTDQFGNVVPFFFGAAEVELHGPLALIGPKTATLRGGLGGVYVKTTGTPGEASVTLKTDQTEPVTFRFIIKTED